MQQKERAKALIKVFLTLSDKDKEEVYDFIRDYSNSWSFEKVEKEKTFLEEFKRNSRIVLGPVSSEVCEFCGR